MKVRPKEPLTKCRYRDVFWSCPEEKRQHPTEKGGVGQKKLLPNQLFIKDRTPQQNAAFTAFCWGVCFLGYFAVGESAANFQLATISALGGLGNPMR